MYQSPINMSHYNGNLSNGSPINIPLVPVVPPTPGPRSIHNIQRDARDRFAGLIFIEKDDQRCIDDYFSEYDFWEPYSESKSYSKRPYRNAHNGIMRDYVNYLCIMEITHNTNDTNEEDDLGHRIDRRERSERSEEYYVLAKRIPNELTALEPYCTCTNCASCVINPLKYIWCSNCTRCLKAGPGFADPKYIEKAKELKAHKIPQSSLLTSYLRGFENIKYLELGVFILILGILGYFLLG